MELVKLYEVRAKVVRQLELGSTGDATRIDFYLEGEVKGRINGRYTGVDYGSVMKSLGETVVVHVHETIETDKGSISSLRRGYAVPQKDGSYKVSAFCVFHTGIKELDFLNKTLGAVEGTAGGGELRLTVYEVR